jgi:1-acyl-sn-glycerol-3-phosphate acyltransferase
MPDVAGRIHSGSIRLLATTALLVPATAAAATLIHRSQTYTPWDREILPYAIAGCLLGCLYWHRYRGLGFVPLTLAAAAGVGFWVWLVSRWDEWTMWVTGALLGFGTARLGWFLTREWGWPVFLIAFPLSVVIGLFSGVELLESVHKTSDLGDPVAFPVWTGFVAAAACVLLFRPAIELAVEPPLWLMYHIRGAGPGLEQVPVSGPCLVLANHACWFDPLFLAKVLPRPITPMMTARFYDLPVMSWLMRRVFHTIRVSEKAIKQDTPELREAIAALDRGACVVIFPEGYLRRSDDKPLKRFGRGIWQILQARPETPVFACWIEGGWGSYTSYYNGRPTKNKKPDVRRRIGVAVTGPVAIDAGTLADHLRTRIYLMNRVAEARKELRLPELPAYELPSREDEEEKSGNADDADAGRSKSE